MYLLSLICRTRGRSTAGLVFGLVFIVASGCAVLPRYEHETELEQNIPAEGATILEAVTDNGSIELSGTDSSQVTLHAYQRVRAPSREAAESFSKKVQVKLVREDDKIRIFKEHPKPPLHTEVQVHYEITCPRQMQVELKTANGKIDISAVDGSIRARTSNGKLVFNRTSGRIVAITSNGSIHADVDTLREAGRFETTNGSIQLRVNQGRADLNAKTSNGSITLSVPADFSGQLEAQTNNGKVSSDFPVHTTITESSPHRPNRLSGRFGEGGTNSVHLRTSNGSISLRRL